MKKYTTQQIQAGIKFLQNKNVSFDFDKDEMQVYINIDVHNNRIWTDGSSIWNNNVVKGVKVENISLIATHSIGHYAVEDRAHLSDDDLYWGGGLTGNINYDGSGKDGTWYDGADDENNALINKIKAQESDGMIYSDDGFIANSINYMEEHCDFNAKLLNGFLDFCYSEQGMQDDGAVNLDVEMDGDFWIKCNDELVKFITKAA
tara:strand:+ start:1770 stop:2381 length:612 start_codon:yes stop_codon:yes gene_type:complete